MIGAVLAILLNIRMIGHDEHYGMLGLGSIRASAADVFTSLLIDPRIEPDFIIKPRDDTRRRALEIDIDDVLVWDNREWIAYMQNVVDTTGGQDVLQYAEAGIIKDNTSNRSQGPTADTIAGRTRPGGTGAAVVGAATGSGTASTNGQDVPPFEARFDYGGSANEEQTAASQVNRNATRRLPENDTKFDPYVVDGITAHHLMTARSYWGWLLTVNQESTIDLDLAMDCRRMSIDIQELMFDRDVFLSILDALVVNS